MMQLTIIGFGNQAQAWAQNLKDSGYPLRIALRRGSKSFIAAKKLDFEVIDIGSDEFFQGKNFALLIPDQNHLEFLQLYASSFSSESIILYAHGFSVFRYQFQIQFPHLNHVLFAPKSIGSEIRKIYLNKGQLGAVYSLEFFKGESTIFLDWIKKLSSAIGINLGPYKTTFEHETQADLFSEQGLLCGLIPFVSEKMFNLLLTKGIEPELAYFECWHELKMIVSAMVEKGPKDFFDLISPNALVGAIKGRNYLVDEQLRSGLTKLLDEIQNGTFNQELDQSQIQNIRNELNNYWSQSALQQLAHKIHRDIK